MPSAQAPDDRENISRVSSPRWESGPDSKRLPAPSTSWAVISVSDGKSKEKKAVCLAPRPGAWLDLLWGYYCADGRVSIPRSRGLHRPACRGRPTGDDVDKLTLGGMAKYTLAANAGARSEAAGDAQEAWPKHYPKDLEGPPGRGDRGRPRRFDFGRLRKECARLDRGSSKRKGPRAPSADNLRFWGPGSGEGHARARLYRGRAALGQVEFGIPCVVGRAPMDVRRGCASGEPAESDARLWRRHCEAGARARPKQSRAAGRDWLSLRSQ